jgi:hypothetical protein
MMSLSQEKHLEIVLVLAITSNYMELIYPEFLRFKDRVCGALDRFMPE